MTEREPVTRVVHLISSGFYGGPERQIVGLANELAPDVASTIGTFPDSGKSAALRAAAEAAGHATFVTTSETPQYGCMIAQVRRELVERRAHVLVTHHYKADLIGRAAAALARVPCCSVSHGWTAESRTVRINERLDKLVLRSMDAVVCVSREQERRVRAAGVAAGRTRAIVNAIDPSRFGPPDPAIRRALLARFPHPPERIVGSVGRLSPEKGFERLVEAAARSEASVGTIVFGEGPSRPALEAAIARYGLAGRFVLAGFDADVGRHVAAFDVSVLPSYTEGLPVVVLEAMAARVAVVATAVGGTPEVVDDGVTGRLVPAGDAGALATALAEVLADDDRRRAMGEAGRARVEERFTFAIQAAAYRSLFAGLTRA